MAPRLRRHDGSDLSPTSIGSHPLEAVVAASVVVLVLAAVVIGGSTPTVVELAARLAIALAAATVAASVAWSRANGTSECSVALTAGVAATVAGAAIELATPYERSTGLSGWLNLGFVLMAVGAGLWTFSLLLLRWRRHEETLSWPLLAVTAMLVGLVLMTTGAAQPLLVDTTSSLDATSILGGGSDDGTDGTGGTDDSATGEGSGPLGGLLDDLAEDRPDGILGGLLGGDGAGSDDGAEGDLDDGSGDSGGSGLGSILEGLGLGLGGRAEGIAGRVTTAIASVRLFSLLVCALGVAAASVLVLRRFRLPNGGLGTFVALSLLPLAIAVGPVRYLLIGALAGAAVEVTGRLLVARSVRTPDTARRLAVAVAPALIVVAILLVGGPALGLDLPPRQLIAPVVHAAFGGLLLAALVVPLRSTGGHQGDPLVAEAGPSPDPPRVTNQRRRSR